MRRKPIANKYSNGTMKSTLHSALASQVAPLQLFSTAQWCLRVPTSSKGSEIESEIASHTVLRYAPHTHTNFTQFSEVQSDRVSLFHQPGCSVS